MCGCATGRGILSRAGDRNSNIGRLDKALDEGRKRGWAITDMKRDWRTIFPAEGTIGATRDLL
jgi:hypothetical protein